mgnify:CR=1 FL=1
MSIKDRLMTYAEVLEHEPMKKHTTFKIGGCVDYYIYPKNCTALMCVLENTCTGKHSILCTWTWI